MDLGFITEDSRNPPGLESIVCYNELPRRCILKSPFSEKTIISYGVVAVTQEITTGGTFRWLLVRRKFNPSFVLILRGSYREASLPTLVEGLTQGEISILQRLLEDDYVTFVETYRTIFSEASEADLIYARKRLEGSETYLQQLLNKLECSPSEPEWLWPKGRPLSRYEDRLSCAQREFSEETGLSIQEGPLLVSPEPLVESSVGLGGKIYETRCWVYLFDSPVELPDISESQNEIGDSRWVEEEEARRLLKSAPGKLKVLEEAKVLVEKYLKKG